MLTHQHRLSHHPQANASTQAVDRVGQKSKSGSMVLKAPRLLGSQAIGILLSSNFTQRMHKRDCFDSSLSRESRIILRLSNKHTTSIQKKPSIQLPGLQLHWRTTIGKCLCILYTSRRVQQFTDVMGTVYNCVHVPKYVNACLTAALYSEYKISPQSVCQCQRW